MLLGKPVLLVKTVPGTRKRTRNGKPGELLDGNATSTDCACLTTHYSIGGGRGLLIPVLSPRSEETDEEHQERLAAKRDRERVRMYVGGPNRLWAW